MVKIIHQPVWEERDSFYVCVMPIVQCKHKPACSKVNGKPFWHQVMWLYGPLLSNHWPMNECEKPQAPNSSHWLFQCFHKEWFICNENVHPSYLSQVFRSKRFDQWLQCHCSHVANKMSSVPLSKQSQWSSQSWRESLIILIALVSISQPECHVY